MQDLDGRALKYSRGAGIIQTGHFDAAHAKAKYNRWLVWASISLTTLVGGSIFVKYGESWPIVTGVLALLAAVVGAVNSVSKFAEESERHRMAAAQYGRVRRRADMLRLKMEGGDLEREEALSQLEAIGEQMSDIAEDSISIPDAYFVPAREKFDQMYERGSKTA